MGEIRLARRGTALLQAAHAGPALAVTALAAAYAASAGVPPWRLGTVTAAVLAGQLSVGWSNDLVDLDRDRFVGRTDKPLVTGEVGVAGVRRACALAVLAAVVLSLALGLLPGLVHLGCVAAAWAYNLHLKSTAWSWLPYALAFGGLPVCITLAGPGPDGLSATTAAGAALLGVGAHLVNVLPDLDDDEATGVRGLGHRLGERRARALAVAALVGATAVLLAGAEDLARPVALAAGAAVVVLGAVALLARGRTPFRAAIAIAFVDVLVLVLAG